MLYFIILFLVQSEASNISFAISDFSNARILLGTPSQELQLSLSFSDNLTTIYPNFAYNESSTFLMEKQNNNTFFFQDYLYLDDFEDKILLSNLQYLDKTEEYQNDGILGLNINTSLFLSSVINSSIVKQNTFSFYLNQNGTGELKIGDLNILENNTEILYENYYSSKGIPSFDIGGMVLGTTVVISEFPAYLSPGSEYIIGPQASVSKIFSSISSKFACSISDYQYLLCPCSEIDNYPDLSISLNYLSLTIDHRLLFSEISETDCKFLMTYYEDSAWALGRPVLFAYSTIFDPQNSQIGFLENQVFPQEEETSEEKPFINSDELIMMVYVIIGCIVIFLTARGIYLLSGWLSSRGQTEAEEQAPLLEDYDAVEIAKFRASRKDK